MKREIIIFMLPFLLASCSTNYHPPTSDKKSITTAAVEDDSHQQSIRMEAEKYNRKIIEERLKKTPVKKGDLFYCKVAVNPSNTLVDSGVRAGIKDNITNFGVIFSNGAEIISPEIKVTEPSSGLRAGESADGTKTFVAAYDGSNYTITTYNVYVATQILGGRYVDRYSFKDGAIRFEMFDCKKA